MILAPVGLSHRPMSELFGGQLIINVFTPGWGMHIYVVEVDIHLCDELCVAFDIRRHINNVVWGNPIM